jgi:Kef-type K+ transport system membrane component KefB
VDNTWLISALWIGLALVASLLSIRIGLSVALVEIVVGAAAGNTFALEITPWVSYLAGAGALVLTFLAGAEIDPVVVRKHFWPSMLIGAMGFVAPFVAVLCFARYGFGWDWPQAEIAGLALSTTSVAVVYAVMVENGYNKTELGKVILAACFVNDLGTVAVLGILFANYNLWLAAFVVVTALALVLLPRFTPWFFRKVGNRVSEPETKFILLLLFGLGGLGSVAKVEPVLAAYLVGMILAPYFLSERVLPQRLRVTAFSLLTPFYFLKAGSLVKFDTVVFQAGVIALLLGLKMAAKFAGIGPLTKRFRFTGREAMYTMLLMSTGLTFGSIAALFGLTNHIIDRDQYTILVTAVIASAVVPTLIAEKWFRPRTEPIEEETSDA